MDKDNIIGRISALRPQALQGSSSVCGKPVDYATARVALGNRYIHAAGFYSSTERTYYEILGVPETAGRDDIKKAFHALAKKYHPDANKNNPSAKRKFQEIREAFEVCTGDRVAAYQTHKRSQGPENVEYAAGDAEGFRYAYRTHFSDSFYKVFSEIFERETDNFASDIQVEQSLSFSEATKGCTKNLSFDAFVPCDSCATKSVIFNSLEAGLEGLLVYDLVSFSFCLSYDADGRGYPLDAKSRVCPTCRGIGRVSPLMIFTDDD
ncbi:Chaperone protein dnaJ 1, mitochondrial [Morella rubra]|uniref:Chaperone protein dnaJ 1, mitochondrial n=1 Tax=Morella rubra TaxID=262757 RepID=A0A6A1UU06_9ROSI|nr:Chaperone protein dnaJ 1, mitochondrial [Morella rubra]